MSIAKFQICQDSSVQQKIEGTCLGSISTAYGSQMMNLSAYADSLTHTKNIKNMREKNHSLVCRVTKKASPEYSTQI